MREDGEKNAQQRIAKAFLNRGIDIAVIAQCTGLTEEEIKKL